MLKIGSHVSFKSPNYLIDSVKESLENGANVLMIYLGPPQSSKRVNIEKYNYEKYLKEYSKIIPSHDIVVHAPYILNLANIEKKDFSIQFIIEEIERMHNIKAKYLVLHPGSSLNYNRNEAIKTLATNLKIVLEKTKHTNVEIILETMAGKGTEIGKSFEELSQLINEINDTRIGICLDTCHMWDAGYDIKKDFEKNDGKELFELLKKLNLEEKIKVIHLNDSKNDIGSHKDRHENIGKGFIGSKALINFANHPKFDNIPIILETPFIENLSPYKDEIKIIKKV